MSNKFTDEPTEVSTSQQSDCFDCGVNNSANKSRRNFTKGALATPVIASMISSPAWGVACSISGLRSTNLSGHNHDDCNGNGCTPGFWKQNLAAWPCTGFSPGSCKAWKPNGTCKEWDTSTGDTFIGAFGFEFPLPDPLIANYTLLDVMLDHEQWGSHGTYFFHLVAALLNASCSPYAYGATPDQVIQLAHDVQDGILYWGDVLPVLDKMNNAGDCFLDAHGNCETGFESVRVVIDPETYACIPACKPGYHFDLDKKQCVPDET